jgi:hypothetical protein
LPRCPGQDLRFWKPEDIFEVECPSCGSSVEFWKDEPQVKCPDCKQVIVNPKLDLGCAKWCKHAEDCLGQMAGQESQTLSNKLIEYLREIAGSKTIRLSLEILSYAEKIQLEEGGDPLVVKASAILSQVHKQVIQTETGKDTENRQGLPVRDILEKHGIENELVDHIFRILSAYQCDTSIDSLEFKIVSDACCLMQQRKQIDAGGETIAETPWGTQTAQRLAREMFNRPEGNGDKTDKKI